MEKRSLAHNDKERTEDVKLQEHITFQQMFLSGAVHDGLKKNGFEKPSPIQLKAIPLGRCGFDLIVKSKSGTGKTVVFTVIALEMIDVESKDLQVLIMAPTREIAVQIADVIESIGCNFKGLKVGTFIGGSPEKDDIEKAVKCQIAVGAPGRVKSLISKKILKLDSLKLFILDEADKLLEKSFQNDINDIYLSLPIKKQIIATSATFPDDLKTFLGNYMRSTTEVSAELKSPLLLGMKQFVKQVKSSSNAVQEMNNKNEVLLKLLSSVSFAQCLIFTNYQTRAETVSLTINRKGWKSTFISAAQPQNKRLEAIKSLKNFKCRILLSTDLTARGIDAANVDLVINYDVPVDVMTYLHRMGRAGRYGAKGVCVSLVSGEKDLLKIRKFLGSIGGASLAVPLIKNLEGENLNLWDAEQDTFEQITGLVEESGEKLDNKEIISMKYHRDENETNKHNYEKNNKDKVTKSYEVNEKFNEVENDNIKGEEDEIKENKVEKMEEAEEKTIENLCSLNINKSEESNERMSLLQSMANGNFNFENLNNEEGSEAGDAIPEDKKRKRNVESEATHLLEMLSRGEYDFSKMDDESMINEESNIKKEENKKRKMSNENDELALKNRALYEVAKIVTDRKRSIDDDVERSLDDYLKYTKRECEEKKEDEEKESKDEEISNIFVNAYRFALGDGKSWKSMVPETELKLYEEDKSKAAKLDEENMKEEEDVEEEYDYYEEEEEEEEENVEGYPGYDVDENGKRIYAYKHIPNRMVWVPVEDSDKPKNEEECPKINLLEEESNNNSECEEQMMEQWGNVEGQTNYYYQEGSLDVQGNNEGCSAYYDEGANGVESSRDFNKEHFENCFQQCSEELWQNGCSFKSVEEFDCWFYQWYGRVQEVSDYVRQNLYVREMSQFQKNEWK